MNIILNGFKYNVGFQPDVSVWDRCEMHTEFWLGNLKGLIAPQLYTRDLRCILKIKSGFCRLDTFCTGPVVGSFECNDIDPFFFKKSSTRTLNKIWELRGLESKILTCHMGTS
jgi:hypothetical protein